MPKKVDTVQELEGGFSQKKINHVFHYNDNFQTILKILRTGFAPSYCEEIIGEFSYYIPMVSFCNIPIRDVDLYMRYGKYGIGMSILWALKNEISPVVYVHEKTPFRNFHADINSIQIMGLTESIVAEKMKHLIANTSEETESEQVEQQATVIEKINNITVPALQFFKNWKTTYDGAEIITYQEREWRFVPNLSNDNRYARLVTQDSQVFSQLKERSFKPKPHIPEHTLLINNIDDIRYIVIKTEKQQEEVLKSLKSRFGEHDVQKAIMSGKLFILQHEIIKDDF